MSLTIDRISRSLRGNGDAGRYDLNLVSHYSQYPRPFLVGVAAPAVFSTGQE